MKKTLSKVFKTPAVIFSAGVIVAFAFFVFFQPQKPAVGIAEANSSKAAEEIKTEAPQAKVAAAPGQESVFLASGSYFNPNAEWSTWFMPPSQERFENGRQQRFTIDLNGDGLLDYMLIGRSPAGENSGQSDRVYLNNGYGWNSVYSCDSGGASYYGDCATTDSSLDHPTNNGCFSDYTSWSHSYNKWNSGGMWNLFNMPFYLDDYNMGGSTADKDFELLADINGDGLPDYVWADDNNSDYILGSYGIRRCVYLNNGHGWDLAYRCVRKFAINGPSEYYGDCAQQ